MLRWLERKLSPLAIPNLTLILIAGQAATFLVGVAQPAIIHDISLIPGRILAGEVWRLLTFPFMAPMLHLGTVGGMFTLLFFLIYLQLFWMFGSAMEAFWGTFRYNVYLLIGYVATVAAAFVAPDEPATNAFLYTSVFLAFAVLNPDFVLHLFFILPVRIKWLALLTWIGYGLGFLTGTWQTRLLILAAVLNFFLFFGRDIARRLYLKQRSARYRAAAAAEADKPFHQCSVCGKTERTDPKAEFRYVRTENGVTCFCLDHLPQNAAGGATADTTNGREAGS